MARLSLSLLGPLQITLDGRPVGGFTYNKARALLVYLAVEADRPHHRDTLVGLFWPDLSDQAARTNLRQALTKLREAIGDAAATPAFLLTTRDTVQFNPDSDFALDVVTFDTGWSECQKHPHRGLDRCRVCAEQVARASELYRGDFLAQFSLPDSAPFEEWALFKREHLRQSALEMFTQLATYHERRGAYELAQHNARRQIELDPWREEAHRQLMGLLARAGHRSAALAQYEACRHALAEGLGVAPTQATTELYERIRDGLEVSTGTPRRLPVPPTALVGRERELKELGELLANPGYRLITIVGPGGIGKTRLALEVAQAEQLAFKHGATLIQLAALNAPELIPTAILAGLGVSLQAQQEPGQQLLDYLRDKELLLVLDNFEQLLADVSLITAIIERAPGITLLITSRERLALQAEWLEALGGLDCPGVETTQGLEAYSAVQLFTQRARQVQRQFSLAGEEARAVARICQQVEGLPLAIELAAASVRHRSCVDLAADIESGLQALAATTRDTPERHRSMRATFEQSWRLLSADEQQVFRRLAVFRGGFDEEAAIQIASASKRLLSMLVDKSLLGRDAGGRYDLHALVWQYADEKLSESKEAERVHTNHLTYFLTLAKSAGERLTATEQQLWLDRLQSDHNNLNAVLAWAHEQADVEIFAQLVCALSRYWYVRGHLKEGRQWLDIALAQKDRLPVAIRARTVRAAGLLAEPRRARTLHEESLALYRMLGDSHSVARVLINLGNVILEQEHYAETKPLFEESLGLYRALQDKAGIADALGSLGLVALHQQDYLQATALFEEALEWYRVFGNKHDIAVILCNLGLAALYGGNLVPAQQWFREGLVISHELGDKENIAWCLEGLAGIASVQGQPAQAVTLYGAAEKLRDTIGVPLPASYQDHYQHSKTQARAQLDEATYNAAWAEGRAMTLEQVILYSQAIDATKGPDRGRLEIQDTTPAVG